MRSAVVYSKKAGRRRPAFVAFSASRSEQIALFAMAAQVEAFDLVFLIDA